jgi:hypothetical protein
VQRKQHVKAGMYRRLWWCILTTIIVIFGFFFLNSFMFVNVGNNDFAPTHWRTRWFVLDGWLNIVYLADVAFIAYLWRPTPNNRRFAMSDEVCFLEGSDPRANGWARLLKTTRASRSTASATRSSRTSRSAPRRAGTRSTRRLAAVPVARAPRRGSPRRCGGEARPGRRVRRRRSRASTTTGRCRRCRHRSQRARRACRGRRWMGRPSSPSARTRRASGATMRARRRSGRGWWGSAHEGTSGICGRCKMALFLGEGVHGVRPAGSYMVVRHIGNELYAKRHLARNGNGTTLGRRRSLVPWQAPLSDPRAASVQGPRSLC